MSLSPRYPSLYQINTRIWLRELSQSPTQSATFDDVADDYLNSLASLGFDWIWPLGVWQTGEAGRRVSRTIPEWRDGYRAALPDLTDDDITGSPFAISGYTVNGEFGGEESLARFRERLRKRGMRLLLDFVPNHTAPDHPWVWEHPEYYIAGDEADLAGAPWNFRRVETKWGPRIIAHGRDPYFPGWRDTLQLNYRSVGLRKAMTAEIVRIAQRCDGLRCDMAMLLLPDVIERTWHDRSIPVDKTPPIDVPFWPEAIEKVREKRPDFLFMAEVYWDREWDLQQQGFDDTYDKRLYDRLHSRDAEAVRGHLRAAPDFQRKSVRFLENHDEPRAASAFPPEVHRAAAIVAFLIPGMRFFHEGQLEGRRQHASLHLGRRSFETLDSGVKEFYSRLFGILKDPAVRDGTWQLLHCDPAWEDDSTFKRFLAFTWDGMDTKRLFVVVNFSPTRGQTFAHLPWREQSGQTVILRDRMSDTFYERDGTILAERGMYLDMPEWSYHVFDVKFAV